MLSYALLCVRSKVIHYMAYVILSTFWVHKLLNQLHESTHNILCVTDINSSPHVQYNYSTILLVVICFTQLKQYNSAELFNAILAVLALL